MDSLHYFVIAVTMVTSLAVGTTALFFFFRYRRRRRRNQTTEYVVPV